MANSFSDILNTVDIERFSTTLLQQYGAQKQVKDSNGTYSTNYVYRRGNESFPQPDVLVLDDTSLVGGQLSENTFTAVMGYFQSRGASITNAETMATLILDSADMIGVSPISLLEHLPSGQTAIQLAAHSSVNALRSVSDQHESVSTINNRKSLKARSILA